MPSVTRAHPPSLLEIDAFCEETPEAIVRFLTGSILACKGWILQRLEHGAATATFLFEFQASFCLEIYAALVACGLHLSKGSHIRLTREWACSLHRKPTDTPAIVSITLRMHHLSAAIEASQLAPSAAPAG